MALAREDIEFIKTHLGEWLVEQSFAKPPAVYEIELRERMVRVEEELRHQRELIQTILVQMDKRFDAVERRFELQQKERDQHFGATEKRFELLQQAMESRFEKLQHAMDSRFEILQHTMDSRFEKQQQTLDLRFEAMDKRFEAADKRFEELTRRIDRFMFWSFGLTVSVGALVVAALRLWPYPG